MASTIKVDKIEGSTGSTVTVPTGQTFTVTDGIAVAGGGTGLTSYTTGDTVYASGTTAISKLGIGTARQGLQTNSGATAPEWVDSPQSLMTAAGDVLYASGANTLAKLAKGSDDDVLTLASGVPSWAASAGGGKLLQVVQVTKTDTTSTTAASFEDLTGMSLAITPTAASSKILIMGIFNFGVSGEVALRFQFDVDSGGYNTIDEFTGDADSTSPRGVSGCNHAQILPVSPMFLHSPTYTLTDVITYKAQWGKFNHSNTAYLNRQYANTGTADYPVMATTLVLMEIGA